MDSLRGLENRLGTRLWRAGVGIVLFDLARDLRFALRSLPKRPVLAGTVVLTLSLGIGMTTTVFGLVDSILLRPLQGTSARQMVYLELESDDHRMTAAPTPQLLRLIRDHATSFSRIEAYVGEDVRLLVDRQPVRARAARASAGFFSFLGVTPALGRGFAPEDGRPAASPVVLLSHRLWKERFGQRRDVLGTAVTIDNRAHDIVGILPADFRVDSREEILLWVPADAAGGAFAEGVPVDGALASLQAGVPLATARAEVDALVRNNPLDRKANLGWVGRVLLPSDLVDPGLKRALLVLQAAAVLVLLIGCGNLANLLLARGEARALEFALRGALGASRPRLVRQLFAEALVLGVLGGIGGILLTVWALDLMPLLLPAGYSGFVVQPRVLVFASAMALSSVLLIGLLPAIRGSRRSLNEVIKGSTPVPRWRHRRIGVRDVLVTAEVAMAVLLLVSASLLVRSFSGLMGMDTAFDRRNLLTINIELPEDRYEAETAQREFLDRLDEAVRQTLPAQVGSAALASGLVENLSGIFSSLVREDASADEAERFLFMTWGVAPEYFDVVGLRLLEGRAFVAADGRGGEKVVILGDAVARTFFGEASPVGRRIRLQKEWYRVVGVAASVRLPAMARSRQRDLQLFFPFRQDAGRAATVIVRARGDRAAAVDIVKRAVWRIDPALPIEKAALVDDLLAESLSQERTNALLMALFAFSGLALGTVGVYGVVAYVVSRRIREMGIRLALGASSRQVVTRLLLGSMKAVGAGLVLGSLGALALGQTLGRLLHEVNPRDPAVFALVVLVTAGVSLTASWLPARRLAGSGPIDALRRD